jgi:hypothetical protein
MCPRFPVQVGALALSRRATHDMILESANFHMDVEIIGERGNDDMFPCEADDGVVCPIIATQVLLMTKGMASMISDETAMRFRFLRNISGLFEISLPLRALLRPFGAVGEAAKKIFRMRRNSEYQLHASNVVVPVASTTVVSVGASSEENGLGGMDRDGRESAETSGYDPNSCACANSTSGTICLVQLHGGHHHHHLHHHHPSSSSSSSSLSPFLSPFR